MNGFQGLIGLGKESTWGVGVAASQFYNATESITEERPQLREPMTFGTRAVQPGEQGRLKVAGSINGFHARPAGIGHILRAALGVPTSSGVAAPYTHVFVPAATEWSSNAPLPAYSATVKRGSQTLRYSGGQCNKATFKQSKDGMLEVDTDWMFKDVAPVAAPVLAADNTTRFRFLHLSIQRAAIDYDFVEDLQISIENNLAVEELFDQTNGASAFVYDGMQQTSIQMTLTFRDLATYDDFRDSTPRPWTFEWAIDANANLKFSIPRLKIDRWGAPISGPNKLTITVQGVAEFDSVAGHALEATLINSVVGATYA